MKNGLYGINTLEFRNHYTELKMTKFDKLDIEDDLKYGFKSYYMVKDNEILFRLSEKPNCMGMSEVCFY